MYIGKYCSGKGNIEKFKLIDDSLSIFHPTASLPNISMIYNDEGNAFMEGAMWGRAFWIQNSYGFIYGSTPFLSKSWAKIAQNSLDMHWDRMGDGKRIGMDSQVPCSKQAYNFRAPDGALGDVATSGGIVYKQGDGDFDKYDWFYEATAAGINMQADILLAHQDMDQIDHYLPLMKRSAEFIERTRDKKNNLFLVGQGCNLLAPSYGATVNKESGEIEKCYLTGVSITYCTVLEKMIELFALIEDKENEKLYTERYKITKDSLSQLLTDEGYLVKYMEQDGTLHGVFGQEKYGYLEGVCNIDAIAFNAIDNEIAQKIYDKINSISGMRPFDFIVNNYPGLDDAPWHLSGANNAYLAGQWVDGGCWGTVEGRAMLAYFNLGKFDDAFKSAARNMKWMEDYRMDQPYSQWGENYQNYWQGEIEADVINEEVKQTGVMIDDFAIPACFIRGLIACVFKHNSIILKPKLPQDIEIYTQHLPIYYGECEIYITIINGTCNPTVTVNEEKILLENNEIVLKYEMLKKIGKCIKVVINYSGNEEAGFTYINKKEDGKAPVHLLPKEMLEEYSACILKYEKLSDNDKEIFLKDVIKAYEAAARRRELPFDKENFRPMTPKKKEEIICIYDRTAQNLYKGIKDKL